MGFFGLFTKKTRRLETLYAISEIAAKAQTLADIWDPLFNEVLKIMKVDAGTLMILEGDFLVRKVARGLDPSIMQEPPIHRSRGGISWSAVSGKKPLVISDLSKVKIASKVVGRGDLVSLVTVPMITHGQVVGVMSLFTRKARQFSKADLNLFTTIANQAAVAIISIQNTKLLEENRRRLKQFSAINEISKSISTLFDFEETIYSIIGVITSLFKADKCLFALYDRNTDQIIGVRPAFGLTDGQVARFRVASDEGVTGKVFCGVTPLLVADSKTDLDGFRRAGIKNIKSLMAAPLRVKSQSLGVIHLASSEENKFSQDDLNLFGILAGSAAMVVNISSMYKLIQETKNKDEAILSSIAEGVLALDYQKRIILFNKAIQKITDFLPKQVMDKNFEETIILFDEDKKPLSQNPIDKIIREQKPLNLPGYCFIKNKKGRFIPVSFTGAPIFDWQNKIIGIIVTLKDQTKEQELEEMKKELLSIATHELRTPITVVKGYLEMILAGDAGKISQEVSKLLKEAKLNNERMSSLVDDLLDVSRIEQGRIKIQIKQVDVDKIIQEIISQFSLEAKKKNLDLIYRKPKTKIPLVAGDTERIKQVISNLISNAIKYTMKGKVEVTAAEELAKVKVSVSDTGIGLTEEEKNNLFQKFYRVRNSETKNITGTGLGLYICQKLIKLMNGEIGVQSQKGTGSTFWFLLPKSK